MTSLASSAPQGSFWQAFRVQVRVIGALILRDLHIRYGRENIGYLWMVGEPLMLATVIGLMHAENGHTAYGSDVQPMAFGVLGYTCFILFRGIVNKAEGSLESSASLLYHRQVTTLDLNIARAIGELGGVFLTFAFLGGLLVCVGLADWPARPLALFAAWGLMFWYAFGHSLVISALTHDNRTLGRFVHPYSYFMVGLSGAFTPLGWLPPNFRYLLSWIPMTSIFELLRYGQFESFNMDYFNGRYIVGACFILTWVGLVCLRRVRSRIHLS